MGGYHANAHLIRDCGSGTRKVTLGDSNTSPAISRLGFARGTGSSNGRWTIIFQMPEVSLSSAAEPDLFSKAFVKPHRDCVWRDASFSAMVRNYLFDALTKVTGITESKIECYRSQSRPVSLLLRCGFQPCGTLVKHMEFAPHLLITGKKRSNFNGKAF